MLKLICHLVGIYHNTLRFNIYYTIHYRQISILYLYINCLRVDSKRFLNEKWKIQIQSTIW